MPKITVARQVELVTEAKEHLLTAIELLKEAKLDDNVQAYLINHLEILASADHGFLSNDINCDKVIEDLLNPEEE